MNTKFYKKGYTMLSEWFNYDSCDYGINSRIYLGVVLKRDIGRFIAGHRFDLCVVNIITGDVGLVERGEMYYFTMNVNLVENDKPRSDVGVM